VNGEVGEEEGIAGFGLAGTIEATSSAQMRKLLDVNYLGTFYAARSGRWSPSTYRS